MNATMFLRTCVAMIHTACSISPWNECDVSTIRILRDNDETALLELADVAAAGDARVDNTYMGNWKR